MAKNSRKHSPKRKAAAKARASTKGKQASVLLSQLAYTREERGLDPWFKPARPLSPLKRKALQSKRLRGRHKRRGVSAR